MARKPVGENLRLMPDAISLMPMESVVVRGFTLSAQRASHSPIGANTRSRSPSCGVPDGTSIRP